MTESVQALELRSIEKRFGATVALAGASLAVRKGSLHVLLGENGAGKTTLLNVAAGLQRPDAGEMLLDGRLVHWKARRDAIAAGVAAVHQHLSLVTAMTVSENVALGDRFMARRFSPLEAARRVRGIAADSGLTVDPDATIAALPIAARQRAEIIKAIAHDPSVLLLDEPTSVLSPGDIVELFAWLRSFVSRGRTAIVVTHRLREALRYADAITVLRSGRTMLASEAPTLSERDVLSAMLGDSGNVATSGHTGEPRPSTAVSPRISLREVAVADESGATRLHGVTLTVHAGEIVGVCGVEGAGQHPLLRVAAGRRVPSSGSVTLPESIGFIPEDRALEALVAGLPLTENYALREAGARRGLMNWPSFISKTGRAIQAFDVRGGLPSTPAGTLSGGNQQRFVLARELGDAPAAVVAENPAHGLDVRASRDVFARLRAARDGGAAVIVYSSDIDEIVALADRVVVCHAGTVREVPVDAAAIGAALVGAQ